MNKSGKKLLFYTIGFLFVLLTSIIFQHYNLILFGIIGLILISLFISRSIYKLYIHAALTFGFGIVVAALIYYGYMQEYGKPYYIGGSDDYELEQWAEYSIQNQLYMPEQMAVDDLLATHNSKGFIWILSWLIRIGDLMGGYHTFAFRIINIAFLTIIGILVYKYFHRYENGSNRSGLILFYGLSLFPNALYLSSHVFRDTISALLIFFIFSIWKRQIDEEKILIRHILYTFILSYVAFWIRDENVVYIIAMIIICFIVGKKNLNISRFILSLPLLLVALVLFMATGVNEELIRKSQVYTNLIMSANDGLSNTIFSIPLLPLGLIVRVFYSLIFPPPVAIIVLFERFSWVIAMNVFIAIGIVLQVFMLPYVIRGVKKGDAIAIAFVTVLLSICITTFTFRHFILVYPFMAILIVREFNETRVNKRIINFLIMAIFLLIGASVYLLI
jgi:hypothetical protein